MIRKAIVEKDVRADAEALTRDSGRDRELAASPRALNPRNARVSPLRVQFLDASVWTNARIPAVEVMRLSVATRHHDRI